MAIPPARSGRPAGKCPGDLDERLSDSRLESKSTKINFIFQGNNFMDLIKDTLAHTEIAELCITVSRNFFSAALKMTLFDY